MRDKSERVKQDEVLLLHPVKNVSHDEQEYIREENGGI